MGAVTRRNGHAAGERRTPVPRPPAETAPPEDDLARVLRVADIAAALDARALHDDAMAFAERIRAGRIHVAVMGQFKRGKSTLVNALLGVSLLPAGVVPVTAVPTVVRHGIRPAVRLNTRDGTAREVPVSELGLYVREAANPDNALGIESIEVFVDSPLLAGGLCLVDTPGLGSVFRQTAQSAHHVIPHVDAAIMVIGADPPLSGDELDLLGKAAREIPLLAVVLNKADRFDANALKEARAFAEERIARLLHRLPDVMEVSALDRLSAQGPPRDWEALLAWLDELTTTRRADVVEAGLARGAQRLVRRCLRELTEMAGSIYRPAHDAERRLEQLRAAVADVADDSLRLRRPMRAASERLLRAFDERRAAFLDEAMRAGAVLARLTGARGAPDRRGAPRSADDFHALVRQHLHPWLAAESAALPAALCELDHVFANLARRGFVHLPALAALLADEEEHGLARSLLDATSPEAPDEAIRSVLDAAAGSVAAPRRLSRLQRAWYALPFEAARRASARRLERDLGAAVARATDAVRGALAALLHQRAAEEEERVVAELRDTLAAAERAVHRTDERFRAGREHARLEVDRLAEWRRDVQALLRETPEPDDGTARP